MTYLVIAVAFWLLGLVTGRALQPRRVVEPLQPAAFHVHDWRQLELPAVKRRQTPTVLH